jgi:hypothetical protein
LSQGPPPVEELEEARLDDETLDAAELALAEELATDAELA